MNKTIVSYRRPLYSALIASLGILGACSDSVMFDPQTPPPQQGGPVAPGGGPVVPQSPDQAAAHGGMTLIIDADAPLGSDEVYALLFPRQSYDAFELQNSDQKIEMKLSMDSEDTNKDEGENYVRMNVTITMKLKGNKTLSQQFVSDGLVTLKNINNGNSNVDIMDGTLKVQDGGGQRLIITAQRTAATDEASARKNAWSGKLMLEKGSKKLKIARLEGIGESQVAADPSDSPSTRRHPGYTTPARPGTPNTPSTNEVPYGGPGNSQER